MLSLILLNIFCKNMLKNQGSSSLTKSYLTNMQRHLYSIFWNSRWAAELRLNVGYLGCCTYWSSRIVVSSTTVPHFQMMRWDFSSVINYGYNLDPRDALMKATDSTKKIVQGISYVCTERIFDSRPFMYSKIFLKTC